MIAMTNPEIRAAQRLLDEHDAEHYDLPLDDPKVLACAFCGGRVTVSRPPRGTVSRDTDRSER